MRRAFVPWLLGMVAILILLNMATTDSSATRIIHPRVFIITMGLVAFVVNVEVPLQGDAISLGYAVGLLMYLIVGDYGFETFASIAAGGAIGGLLQAWWRSRAESGPRVNRRIIEWPIMAASQMVISLAAGDLVYRKAGGSLPLTELQISSILPLLISIAVSLAAYLALYSLSLWWRGLRVRSLFKNNRLAITLASLLPIPFILVAAFVFPVSIGGFGILLLALLIMAIGATALGRGQLQYQHQLVELQSLSAVNRTMRTYLDLDALLNTIHLQVATLLDVENFTLALYDSSRNILNFPLVMRQWQKISLPSRELGMGLIDHVVATQAPLLLSQNPVLRARAMGLVPPDGAMTSWLGAPLLAPDRALGCIAVYLETRERFLSERDQRLLVAIATQSSIAIENAQLYRQVQERAGQLTRLNNLSTQLSGTLDPQRVFDLVAESAAAVASADAAAVFLWWDDAHKSMALARSWGLSDQFTVDAPLPLTGDNSILPLVVQNVRLESRAVGVVDVMVREGINAWIELPLSNGDEQIGVLVSYYKIPRQFSGDEIELLKTFANQATLSISNARLYRQTDLALERRIEQLSALAAINKEITSTLNLDTVFARVLDRAIEATYSSHGVLLLNDSDEDKPRLVASRGNGAIGVANLMDHGAISQAYATGKPTIGYIADNALAQLGVPILRNVKVLGVIMLVSDSPGAFKEDEINFVSQLATQATIAMDNARLFGSMRDSRNRLQVILDSMHEAVLMFEPDGKIALANPRVEPLLGLDATLIAEEHLSNLLRKPGLNFAERLGFDTESLVALFETLKLGAWHGGGRLSYRMERPRTIFIDRTIVSVLDPDNQPMGLLMVFNDATEERELAQAREDLSRMIVHDLRSPLTAINASMKLLNEMVTPNDAVGNSIRRTTDVSQRALRKLLHLVDSLLDIAKMESGNISLETETVDLCTIAETVRMELSPLAEELDIQIGIHVDSSSRFFMIDPDKVERVLLNLVDNALKFTPVGGLVEIRARPEKPGRARVEVTDNGPGVPDDYKIRIFDRFQQADQKTAHRRGTGLGLTFCKLTVEAHGGSIWIEDNPGGGSVFAFTLPLTNQN